MGTHLHWKMSLISNAKHYFIILKCCFQCHCTLQNVSIRLLKNGKKKKKEEKNSNTSDGLFNVIILVKKKNVITCKKEIGKRKWKRVVGPDISDSDKD